MRRSGRIVAALATVVGAMATARAQTRVWQVEGAARRDRLGASLVMVPDIDGDGVPDLLVGSPGSAGYLDPGRAALRSGATGALLREWVGTPSDVLGIAVAQLGDLDGDGIVEVALESRTTTFVESGATGAQLYSIPNLNGWWSMAAVGDLDGDGIRDLVIASSGSQASVYSGRTGSFLRQHSAATGEIWAAVDRAGDVDADGVDDYVIGAMQSGSSNGSAYVFSGATGGPIWTLVAANGQSYFGWSVSGAGDVDGDGHADVIVGNPYWVGPPFLTPDGRVWVYSGATGNQIWTRSGTATSSENLGSSLSETGDLDGDGFPDVVVGCASGGTASLEVRSGASGTWIGAYRIHRAGATALDATTDLTGDGIPDLVVGLPSVMADPLQDYEAGTAVAIDPTSGATLFEVSGKSFISLCGAAMAVLPDRDGDGIHEVAVGLRGGLGDAAGTVEVRSGSDGHLLARTSATTRNTSYGAALTPLDDVDGDGVRDYAVGSPYGDTAAILSGADDSLLTTLQGPTPGQGFGTSLAAGTDAAGNVLLAVGEPHAFFGSTYDGAVSIYDAASGALVIRVQGPFVGGRAGFTVACIGDVDGDGTLDWVTGAPSKNAIYAFSGAAGHKIWTYGTSYPDQVGGSLAVPGDFDGDGIADVAIGSPVDFSGFGHVLLLSGKDGSTIARLDGTFSGDWFGEGVGALGDVNGDGVPDFAVGAVSELDRPGTGRVDVVSGATLGRLASFFGDDATHQFGGSFATTDLGSDTRVDPDAIPDLLIGSVLPYHVAGTAELRRLDDVMLQIDPDVATAGQSVAFATRGGPNGSLVGLDLVAFDGGALQQWAAFGTFGVDGTWTFTATVPPGLSGHVLTLRSYAIGFAGKVVDSSDATLTLQ